MHRLVELARTYRLANASIAADDANQCAFAPAGGYVSRLPFTRAHGVRT